MLRFYDAVSAGDLSFMDRWVSSQPEVLLIGTDPNEWWTDLAVAREVFKAQAQAGIKAVPGDIVAFREGTVGWVADRPKFLLADGTEISFLDRPIYYKKAVNGRWLRASCDGVLECGGARRRYLA